MEMRRQELEQIEQEMPPLRNNAPLERVYRRLDRHVGFLIEYLAQSRGS